MLRFKQFKQLLEGSGEQVIGGLLALAANKFIKNYKQKKAKATAHKAMLDKHVAHADFNAPISKEPDHENIAAPDVERKQKEKEEKKNKKKWDEYQGKLHNYAYGPHTWTPDKYDPTGEGPDVKPEQPKRVPKNPLLKKPKKPKDNKPSFKDTDILDQMFGPEKK